MANDGIKVVVGLGKSGLACARFLLSQGARVAVPAKLSNEVVKPLPLVHRDPPSARESSSAR